MSIVAFRGFAGVRLEADSDGAADDSPVLLLHGSGQSRAVWHAAATALVAAGRRVVNLGLRDHGGNEWPADARYDIGGCCQSNANRSPHDAARALSAAA